MGFKVAVGGATGNVGQELLRVLKQRNFPIDSIVALASVESAAAGRMVTYVDAQLAVGDLQTYNFSQTDFLFLSAGAEASRKVSPRAASQGCIVVDNSSAFRMDPDVPLLVPEVNGDLIRDPTQLSRGILPVANCSTIQLVMVLKPLQEAAGLKRVVVDTYQSAAGGGRRMLNRLLSQADPVELNMRSLLEQSRSALLAGSEKPLAFNVVPHIDVFLEDGRTKEEWKMEVETRKILGLPSLPLAATCVRVPVLVGHAEAVHVELERPLSAERARDLLRHAPGVQVVDETRSAGYATPLDCAGEDPVFVSRIRNDPSVANGLSLWIVADNIRKGAALNAVQIAEGLIAAGRRPRAGLEQLSA